MNYSISNLSWNFEDSEAYKILKNNSISLLEISLTRQFESWHNIDSKKIINFKNKISNEHGLAVCSLQSIFYKKRINIFDNNYEVLEHFKKIINFADLLQCKYLVFGSPSIRKTRGKSMSECDDIFLSLFEKIAEINPEITIGIETNPPCYGNEYLTTHRECANILNKLAKNNVCFHLDTSCVFLGGEDIFDIYNREKNVLKHIHISAPNLGLVTEEQKNKLFLNYISNKNNNNNVTLSIEMLNKKKVELDMAIKFVKENAECQIKTR